MNLPEETDGTNQRENIGSVSYLLYFFFIFINK